MSPASWQCPPSHWSAAPEPGCDWTVRAPRYRPLSSCHTTCDTGPGQGEGIVNNEIRLAEDLRAWEHYLPGPGWQPAILDALRLGYQSSDAWNSHDSGLTWRVGGQDKWSMFLIICILCTGRVGPAYLDLADCREYKLSWCEIVTTDDQGTDAPNIIMVRLCLVSVISSGLVVRPEFCF